MISAKCMVPMNILQFPYITLQIGFKFYQHNDTIHDNTHITTVVSHYSADVSKYPLQHAQYIRTNLLSSLYQVSDREKEKKPL